MVRFKFSIKSSIRNLKKKERTRRVEREGRDKLYFNPFSMAAAVELVVVVVARIMISFFFKRKPLSIACVCVIIF